MAVAMDGIIPYLKLPEIEANAEAYTDLALEEAKEYTDTRIDSIIPGFNYKGSVATVADLPTEGNEKGDCYNVEDGSGVYAWDGDSWGSASKVGPQGAAGEKGDKGDKGDPGAHSVSVSGTGTSTNDVRYITIDGSESRFASVALRAMKSAWKTGTTAEAATAILNDDGVIEGDGFLATVYWSDLPGDITQAEVKAFVLKKGTSYQKIIQFECTSGSTAPYAWFYNSYEGEWRSYVPINNTLTSTSTDEALSANMGKSLNDRVNNIESVGRYLDVWNCVTGKPVSDPPVLPYTYKNGDYYVIGTVAESGGTNYMPNGSTYTGAASTTAYTGEDEVTATMEWRYNGTNWYLRGGTGGGKVADVRYEGTSIVSGKIAEITDNLLQQVKYTSQTLTDGQKTQARTNIGAQASVEVRFLG